MNYKMMGRFIAQILVVEGIFMSPAAIISICCGEYPAMWSFLISVAACCVVSLVLHLLCKGAPSAFFAKEGLVCVPVRSEQELALCMMQLLFAEPADEENRQCAVDAAWSYHIGGGTDEA